MNRRIILCVVGVAFLSGCTTREPRVGKNDLEEAPALMSTYPELQELDPSAFPIPDKTPYDAAHHAELKEGYVKGYLDGITEYMVSLEEGQTAKAVFRPPDTDYLRAYARGRDDGWVAAEKKVKAIIKTRPQPKDALDKK